MPSDIISESAVLSMYFMLRNDIDERDSASRLAGSGNSHGTFIFHIYSEKEREMERFVLFAAPGASSARRCFANNMCVQLTYGAGLRSTQIVQGDGPACTEGEKGESRVTRAAGLVSGNWPRAVASAGASEALIRCAQKITFTLCILKKLHFNGGHKAD